MTRRPRFPRPARPRSHVHLLSLAAALAILQSRPTPACAATDIWTAGTGNWDTPANWSTNAVPGVNDNVNITETDGANRTITYDYTGPSVKLDSLTINLSNAANSGNTTLFSMTANTLSAGIEYVGQTNGTGSFSQSGGNNSVPSSLILASNPATTGFYSLSGNGTLSTQNEYVGIQGNGTFTQTGGTNSISQGLTLGDFNNGNYALSGNGTLSAQSETVGSEGNGTFTQTGGTNAISQGLTLGGTSGSNGNYALSGNGTLSTQGEIVGDGGNGTFTQTGGTNAISQGLTLGGSKNSNGNYALSGNGTLASQTEMVGYIGNGTFTQTGGTNTITSGYLYLGGDTGSSGSYLLGGTGSLTAGFELVGSSGNGTFTQTGGTNTISNQLVLADSPACTGNYILSGGILALQQNDGETEYVGYNGNGTFTQTGGTNALSNHNETLYVGFNGGSGYYSLSGNGTLNANGENLGFGGNGTFSESGGTNTIGSGGLFLGYTKGSTGIYTLIGNATLNASAETIGLSGNGTFAQTGGINTIGSGGLTLGNSNTAIGTYSLTGSGYLSSAGNESVGNAIGATATFIQTGGINAINAPFALNVGAHVGATGAYTLIGDGELNASAVSVGNPGIGAFTQSGGVNTIGHGGLLLGNSNGSIGNYTLGGSGDLSASGNESIGANGGTGTFIQSGGINTINAPSALLISDANGSTGTYNLAGGALSTATIQIGPGGTFSQTAGTLSVTSLQLLGGAASFQNTTAKLSSLTFTGSTNNWSGQLDLANATIIVEATTLTKSTLLATLQNQAFFGTTHSAGITNASLPTSLVIAVLDNAKLGYTFLNGQPVDANSILLSPELLGDANADGHVNLFDLSTILNNFGATTSSWTSGNFDGQPSIDLTDLSDVLNNFGQSNPNAFTSPALAAPSPEPASLAVTTFGAIALLVARQHSTSRERSRRGRPIAQE